MEIGKEAELLCDNETSSLAKHLTDVSTSEHGKTNVKIVKAQPQQQKQQEMSKNKSAHRQTAGVETIQQPDALFLNNISYLNQVNNR